MASSTYRRASRPRPPGGRGAIQPPLLNTVYKRDTDPPPSPTPASNDDLLEALRDEGVRVAASIVRDFDEARIRAALEAYQEVEDAGAGLLVWMIREGCEPRRPRRDDQAEWIERRQEIHQLRQERVS